MCIHITQTHACVFTSSLRKRARYTGVSAPVYALCIYIDIYTHIYTHTYQRLCTLHIYIYTRMKEYVYIYIYTLHIYIYLHVRKNTCMCVCMCKHKKTCAHRYVFIHGYICTYLDMYMYIFEYI